MRVKEIREKARGSIKGKWVKTSVLLYLMALIVSAAMSGYIVLLSVGMILENETLEIASLFFLLPGYIVQVLMQLGIVRIFINIAKGKDYKFSEMFWGAKYWLKTLGVIFLTVLYTMLWSFLFIIPGIIKSFSYSMALYVLAENPEKGIRECINESKEIMKGNKIKYFWLCCSITLWEILYIALMYGSLFGLGYVLPKTLGSNAVSMLIVFILMFLLIIIYVIIAYVIMSYLYVAKAVMYLDISKKEVVDTFEEEIIEESTAKDSENDEELSDTSFETEENTIISSDTDSDN